MVYLRWFGFRRMAGLPAVSGGHVPPRVRAASGRAPDIRPVPVPTWLEKRHTHGGQVERLREQ